VGVAEIRAAQRPGALSISVVSIGETEKGFHPFRICFEWRDGDAHSVEIADYH
jgi:plasmid maintenance system killer protein